MRVDRSFSGFKMQDANEFLTRILDTTKDEIDRCHSTTPSPDRVQSTLTASTHREDEGTLNEEIPLSGLKTATPAKHCDIVNGGCSSDREGDIVSAFAQTNISTPNGKCNGVKEEDDARVRSNGDTNTTDADVPRPTATPELAVTPKKNAEEPMARNPVKDNFEFQLHESYRCLG